MRLDLVRTIKAPDHTEGKLSIDGVYFCATLERPDDGKNTPNFSAIPEGTYKVMKRWSHHLGYDVLGLCDVPGRTDVEIHKANMVSEIKGCIAVGKQFIANGFLSQSAIPFGDLMKRFREPCTITIESAVDVPNQTVKHA